jgi:hypothetical protein
MMAAAALMPESASPAMPVCVPGSKNKLQACQDATPQFTALPPSSITRSPPMTPHTSVATRTMAVATKICDTSWPVYAGRGETERVTTCL